MASDGESRDIDYAIDDFNSSKRQSITLRPMTELFSENTTTLSKPFSGNREFKLPAGKGR